MLVEACGDRVPGQLIARYSGFIPLRHQFPDVSNLNLESRPEIDKNGKGEAELKCSTWTRETLP